MVDLEIDTTCGATGPKRQFRGIKLLRSHKVGADDNSDVVFNLFKNVVKHFLNKFCS